MNNYLKITVLAILFFGCNSEKPKESLEINSPIVDYSSHDDLTESLRNLGGIWSFYNKKTKSTYNLSICLKSNSLIGTYKIYNKMDDWGTGTKHEYELINSGEMQVIEGFDEFRDKAYVGNDLKTGMDVFVLATDIRLLRIKEIEADMFGERMRKVSHVCK